MYLISLDHFFPFILPADVLGIKELLPPYANSNLQPEDLITGVCFASGGAGFDPLTSQTAVIKEKLFDRLENVVNDFTSL